MSIPPRAGLLPPVTSHLGDRCEFAGLYDRDGERTDHSTADDIVGVFVVTAATWVLFATAG